MPATFKTEQDVYDDVVTYVQTQLPEITNWSAGSPEHAIARAIAFGMSMAWKLLYIVYSNIWVTTADILGIRNWYEVFGIAWDSPTLEEGRRQMLASFRERHLGTKAWYEETAVEQFDEVTEATYFNGRRGVNTADLFILNNGGDVMDTAKAAVQTYFDNTDRKVLTLDLAVITLSDLETEGIALA